MPEVDLVWFGDPAIAPPGAQTHSLRGLPYPILDTALGRRLVARADVDVFHFTGNTAWTAPGPVPFVLTIHDLIFMESRGRNRSLRQIVGHRYSRRRMAAGARAATCVATPSRVTADAVVNRLGLDPQPCVIHQGVTQPGESASAPASDPPYAVAFAGRDPRKGVDVVLEALRLVEAPTLRLKLLAGAGLPDGFEQRAARELETRQVEILPYLPRDEVEAILGGARALVYPSQDEGFGFPVIEAMAAGIPVITGLAPVTLEVGGDVVLRIDPDAPAESIAASLHRLEQDPALRSRLSARGRARAREFTWERAAGRYLELYRRAAR